MKEWKEYVFGFRKVLIDDKVSEATYDSKGTEDRMEIVTWFVHGEKRSLFNKSFRILRCVILSVTDSQQ